MTNTTTLKKQGENAPHRRHPFDFFEYMRDELARVWGEPFPFISRWPIQRLTKAVTASHPRVDMYEKNGGLIIKADLPGVKKEDIELSIDEGDLIIQGKSKAESEAKEEDYYRWERVAGSFYRRVALPVEIKQEEIEANFKDGVLEIRIPRAAERKPEPKKIAGR